MKALVVERSRPRFAAARVAGALSPGAGARVGALRLTDIDEPELPGSGWQRVRPRLSGICGSDLATVDAVASQWFEPIVSFPFVPGHEVVGEVDGTRVVINPLLACAAREIDPPCEQCEQGQPNRCERLAFGHLQAGLQTGYCADTSGGWSTGLVAHDSQLNEVPDTLTDEAAVLVEPTACAVHLARQVRAREVAVIGAGTLGLLTIAALRAFGDVSVLLAAAKHPDQRRLAGELGAEVVEPGDLNRAVRRRVPSAFLLGRRLTGGVDVVVDAVGSEASLRQALEVVGPGGTILLLGMPGPSTTADLTPLWHREVSLRGVYAYTTEDFATAFDLVADAALERLMSATYQLERYRDAIDHAANAGSRGAVKVAFDIRKERR